MTVIGLLLTILTAAPPAEPAPRAGSWVQADYSGTYYVAIGHSPQFTMELVHSGALVTYTITGKNMLIEGTGTVTGETMTLEAELADIGDFSAVTDAVFRIYRERGASSRQDFIIPQAERDADPLTCHGEQFDDIGNLENYFTLWDQPTPRQSDPGRLSPE